MNPRIRPLSDEGASESLRTTFGAIKDVLGMVPNLHRSLAHSPQALQSLLAMGEALDKGSIRPQLAEKIAIATAVANSCSYCASAHNLIGASFGISEDELNRSLQGSSADPKTAAILKFVAKLVERRGRVSDTEFDNLRTAGLSDASIVDVIAHVAMNIFTNLINNALQTELDIPEVKFSAAGS